MRIQEEKLLVDTDQEQGKGTNRRAFLSRASIAGAVGAAGFASLLGLASASTKGSSGLVHDDEDENSDDLKKRDHDILIAAEIAEALAVTTYSNIIDNAPFFTRLASDDQGYLRAARQEEMSHYLLEKSVTGEPSPFKSFFYPKACSRTRRLP
jgi:hypothetical protein